MNTDIINTSTSATMSSLEIAELCGKDHKNVTRDIEKILSEVSISPLKFEQSYVADNGQTYKCYELPRMECDLVVSGYSVKYRLAIIKRWHELEAKNSKPLSPMEMVIQSAQAIMALEEKVKVIESRQDLIERCVNEFTIMAYWNFADLGDITLKDANALGRKVAAYCRENGFPIGKQPDPRFGKVNSYPEHAIIDVARKEGYIPE